MKLVQRFLTKNPCYKAGRVRAVKGLMLHSVGCCQPSAEAFINKWDSASYSRACVHGFIDANTGVVYQTLPWTYRGWHCGSGSKGSGNNTHIGVEMCEPKCLKYTGGSNFVVSDKETAQAAVKRTYQAAVELFAMLCEKYNLDPLKDGVIISHKEGHARGIASNHGDPEHLWRGVGLPYTMDSFRKAVKAEMVASADTADKQTGTEAKASSSAAYKVKVTADELNVRSGAGASYPVETKIKRNEVYTIVAESNGWGRLKSGAGWINLKYVKKV